MKFDEVLRELDEYTAPPKDGDYDRHVIEAMRATYVLLNQEFMRYLEFVVDPVRHSEFVVDPAGENLN